MKTAYDTTEFLPTSFAGTEIIDTSGRMAQMTEWVRPSHTNALGILFGGVLVSWIDVAGVAAAQRYARANVVTLSIDHLQFLAPIKVGEMVLLRAKVTYVGKTSMEIEVIVQAEDTVTGQIELAGKGYVTYVALDAQGKAKPVPPFTPGTDAEWEGFRAAESRRAQRRQWR